jgi:hypothetical protein
MGVRRRYRQLIAEDIADLVRMGKDGSGLSLPKNQIRYCFFNKIYIEG